MSIMNSGSSEMGNQYMVSFFLYKKSSLERGCPKTGADLVFEKY
jgi:hypothetical protein